MSQNSFFAKDCVLNPIFEWCNDYTGCRFVFSSFLKFLWKPTSEVLSPDSGVADGPLGPLTLVTGRQQIPEKDQEERDSSGRDKHNSRVEGRRSSTRERKYSAEDMVELNIYTQMTYSPPPPLSPVRLITDTESNPSSVATCSHRPDYQGKDNVHLEVEASPGVRPYEREEIVLAAGKPLPVSESNVQVRLGVVGYPTKLHYPGM